MTQSASNPVIHWFRRDLRLEDNTALHHALQSGASVLPLFIFDETLLNSEHVGAVRFEFLHNALQAIDEQLRTHGAQLIVRRGQPEKVIAQLIAQTNASALYFNADYTPYARRRDERLKDVLSIDVQIYDDLLLIPPGEVTKDDGGHYVVFTPFKKKWNTFNKPAIMQTQIKHGAFYHDDDLTSDVLPSLTDLSITPSGIFLPPATHQYAMHLLETFAEKDMRHYENLRNDLPINPFAEARPNGTSYLSPYLRFGILSPRQAYWHARDAYSATNSKAARESIASWVSELTWREFYMNIIALFPHVAERDFVDTYANLQWHDDPQGLQAWQEGQTGYPIIDAPMRQLKKIGWMPNRARMIVASFLTKDLLIHWREGEQHFMQYLIDGDPSANNGGWQWAAGTGTDAQPYFRIFNPISQSKKFATPEYLRHWLPELRDVSDRDIHAPWLAKNPPSNYPPPIVDHKQARELTLSAFKTARGK